MRQLAEHQKEFIANNFFEVFFVDGWKNIALDLLKTGTCIVAGTKPIWVGGIGNFIKAEIATGAYGCLKYTFDIESFLSSEWYKASHAALLVRLEEEAKNASIKYDEIKKLQS